jgi:hypothetical protein
VDDVVVNGEDELEIYFQFTFFLILALTSSEKMSTTTKNEDNNRKKKSSTINKVNDKLDEIIIERQQISLLCPLSQKRIVIPVLSQQCKPHRIIDKSSLEMFANGKNIVSCPECLVRIDIRKDLIIVDWFDELLSKTDVNETMVWIEGDYHTNQYEIVHNNQTEIIEPSIPIITGDDEDSTTANDNLPLPKTWIENRIQEERKRQRLETEIENQLERVKLIDSFTIRVEQFKFISLLKEEAVEIVSPLHRALMHEICENYDVLFDDVDDLVIMKRQK